MSKNKTIATFFAIILVSSMFMSIIPTITAYNDATQKAIDEGMIGI